MQKQRRVEFGLLELGSRRKEKQNMGVRVPKTKKTEASKALERSATTISPNSIKYETPPSVFWDWQEDEPQLMNNASSLKTRIGQTLCILNLLRDRTRLLSTPLVQSVIAED